MAEVFAVVVNYNGSPWIESCLQSLRRSDHPVSIVVVDNASRDDSVAIARSVAGVEVIQQRTNLGFGKANNVGIAHAMRRGAEFVFLLNQDAEVEPNTISALLAFMRVHADAGVASPVHLNDTGTLLDRNFLMYYLAPQAPEFISDAYGGDLAGCYRMSSVNAAAWLISRRCLQEVGGFDPIFFMYGEDDDYCARMAYHGFSCFVVPQARIRHARGFHQPAYRPGRLRRLVRSARFARAQAVRALKNPADQGMVRSAYRELTTLVLESLSKSLASLSPAPMLPSLLGAAMVCRDLPKIARHKRACQARGPTWLDFRIDPVPTDSARHDLPVIAAERNVADRQAAPLVTLGMPIYNGARFLEASLDSLLAQTCGDFEIVISDNGSDDGTADICRRYAAADRRVRYVRHEANRGAAWNHNFVIAEARGRFFRWHHADDLCEPRHLERCVAALESDPRVVLAYPRTMLIDALGRVTSHYDDRLALSEEAPHARFRHLLANLFLCNTVLGLMRIDALRRTALLGYYVRSDHVLLAELAMAGRWAEVPEELFYRRVHAGKSTEANRSIRERAAWVDPRLRSGRFFWPNLRLFVEHLKAVGRASLGLQDRLLCLRAVIVWQAGLEAERLRKKFARARSRLAGWAGMEPGRTRAVGEPMPQTVAVRSGAIGAASKARPLAVSAVRAKSHGNT
jgi:GT2 family glycosyltransferase